MSRRKGQRDGCGMGQQAVVPLGILVGWEGRVAVIHHRRRPRRRGRGSAGASHPHYGAACWRRQPATGD